jgi:hypothetical protein
MSARAREQKDLDFALDTKLSFVFRIATEKQFPPTRQEFISLRRRIFSQV